MKYIRDISKDEIRSGFLVTASRKKIWQKEIEILLEIDRICRKYNIQYYADSGTLLGAVRHGGFIPWDDDIDILMMRPDYEKFKSIAENELADEYFLQNTYNDVFISSFSKVMNLETSAIEALDDDFRRQGLFVDIFPYDVANNGNIKVNKIMRIAEELWCIITTPDNLLYAVNRGYNSAISKEIINKLSKMSVRERMKEYEQFMTRHFMDSEYVHNHVWSLCQSCLPINIESFSEVKNLSFEGITIPVPIGYDEILCSYYGDWHNMLKGASCHNMCLMSADISYKEIMYYCKEI